MKKLFLLCWMIILGLLHCSAEEYKEYFSVGNPIEYCGKDYYFAYSIMPRFGSYLQEYLPEDQNFDNFTDMLSIQVVFGNESAKEHVAMKIAELEERKKTDPVINYMCMEKEDNLVLEFIVSHGSDGFVDVVEVDVQNYRTMTIGGRQVLVLTFYSARAYGDDILPFIQSISSHRVEWYEGMANLKIAPVMVAK